MRHIDLFSGIGGFALAATWVWGDEYENVGHSEIEKSACESYHKHFEGSQCLGDIRQICSLPLDSLAKMLQLQEQLLVAERDLPVSEQDCFDSWQSLLQEFVPNGSSWKMFPDFSVSTKAPTWRSSSQSFPRSGMVWRGTVLTRNTSELRRDANASGLSAVLETVVPQKYFLSNKAIAGMLRRSIGYGRSGYVFLQETGADTTHQIKTLSLQSLLQVITEGLPSDSLEMKVILSHQQSQQATSGGEESQDSELTETSSDTQLQAVLEELLRISHKKILLRRLMPIEKERLMGFPENWTVGSDNQRGKALGNAIVPQCAAVIMEAIKEATQ